MLQRAGLARLKEPSKESTMVYLTKQYPNLCTLNTSKKSGYTEIRLRDTRPDNSY